MKIIRLFKVSLYSIRSCTCSNIGLNICCTLYNTTSPSFPHIIDINQRTYESNEEYNIIVNKTSCQLTDARVTSGGHNIIIMYTLGIHPLTLRVDMIIVQVHTGVLFFLMMRVRIKNGFSSLEIVIYSKRVPFILYGRNICYGTK